jgi:3-oxoacyl-[acyl-carrier protein] reductase
MALSLAGKHCAVVGATGVIGSSIAKAFASQGAVLTLLSRSILKAQPTFEADLARYTRPETSPLDRPDAHRFIPVDVSQPDNIKSVFSSKVDKLDILVNCAGISQTTLLKRTPDAELDNVINTNLLATMLACKYAKLESKGCIINVSSLMATRGAIGATAYAASKAGVVGT